MIRFDVYGMLVDAERTASGWRLSVPGTEGKRRPLDAAIPDFVTSAEELAQYLDDLYHEAATPQHPAVRRISGAA